jgi:hypothetical protein
MKEKLLIIGKGAMTALSLIVSVINLVDFGVGMARKYRNPKTVEGFTAPAAEN